MPEDNIPTTPLKKLRTNKATALFELSPLPPPSNRKFAQGVAFVGGWLGTTVSHKRLVGRLAE
jgi:hypothetical protein